ncbi:hypothetical protein Tco_0600073 [Tanacetum coccineum]|uniref:Uncharacterized protein n=1 Tax=Tanacetum coccineum TaxID=301880 RepID=A0ABQ4WAQ9_9ASTR
MSDSEDSTVTHTAVSSPFEGLSDIGSSRVDGPPVMPEDPYAYVGVAFQAPPSPDYVLGPEQAPPSPIYVPYVPEPVYPEFMPPEDESDPEEDPEEDPADYLVDGGDNDDDDDESFDDDEDDDDDVEEDDDEDAEEEEEQPALADFVPPPVHRVKARISIPAQTPTPFWFQAEVDRLLAVRTPPPSPLTPLSSLLPQIPSPPLLVSSSLSVSSPLPVSPPPPASIPPSGTPPLLPISAPTSSLSLLLLSTDHRVDAPEVCLPPWKRLCIAFGPRYKIGESLSALAARPTGGFKADYGFIATMDREIRQDLERDVGYVITYTWDEMLEDMLGAPATDETELGRRMTNFVTTVR